ncbi:MAG: hypothetical protein ACRENB_14705, partial [Gemmatimonadales bacterium]
MSRLDRRIAVLAAVLVAGLGLLPIANWIPAGYAIPGWPELFDGWWSGTALVAGLAVVLAIVSRRVPILASPAPWRALSAAWDRHPALAAALLALVAGAAYLWAALSVFSGRPLLIDELVQVYQARTFADGALTRAAGPHPEFFSSNLILERGGRFFAQFPAGGPAMLALGSLVGAEWLVGPLFGVLSAMLFAMLARRLEPRPGVAMAAACLFALAPFVVFMSGSHMNHVTLLTWLLVAWTGLARLTGPDPDRVRAGLLTGLGFGVAATIRPMDAVAFAVPAGAWLLVRSVRRRSLLPLLAAGAGVALPVAIQLWINAQTTGAPLLFAYNANWGANMSLGFHETPWGEQHTPARGLELLNLYFLRLETYFLELPIPSLLPAVAALALSRRLAAFDRYLLTSAALLAGLYFAYWHDGFYPGPRFLYPLLPMLALWTARALPLLRERVAEDGLLSRSLGFAAFVAVVLGLATSVPLRAREYRNGMLTMRWNPDAAAGAAGVRNALVLVRESWGAALVARMWAAGVTPSDAERIYRKADACALERALDAVEERALRGDSAEAVLRPLTRDSSRLVRSPYTTDPSNRLLPGSVYTEECLARLAEDQRGFTLFPPLLLSRREDLVYAR